MYFSLELSVKRSFTSIHPNPFWNDLQQWSKYGKETIAWMFLRSINNNYPTIIYEHLTAFNKHHWSDTLSLSVCQCQHQLPPPLSLWADPFCCLYCFVVWQSHLRIELRRLIEITENDYLDVNIMFLTTNFKLYSVLLALKNQIFVLSLKIYIIIGVAFQLMTYGRYGIHIY